MYKLGEKLSIKGSYRGFLCQGVSLFEKALYRAEGLLCGVLVELCVIRVVKQVSPTRFGQFSKNGLD